GWRRIRTESARNNHVALDIYTAANHPDIYRPPGCVLYIISGYVQVDFFVRRFPDSEDVDARQIGAHRTLLAADYVVEGSVLRAGQQLRINAHLIRVRDDYPLWSGTINRELTDILVAQEDVSRGIVNSLRLKLGGGRRRYETSVEAYDLYLRARAF